MRAWAFENYYYKMIVRSIKLHDYYTQCQLQRTISQKFNPNQHPHTKNKQSHSKRIRSYTSRSRTIAQVQQAKDKTPHRKIKISQFKTMPSFHHHTQLTLHRNQNLHHHIKNRAKEKKNVPKSNALEIISSLGQRNKSDEHTRLHLRFPLFRLIILHQHHRLRPPTHRRRSPFAARKRLQPALHLLPPHPRRRIRAPGPPVRAVKLRRLRRRVGIRAVPVPVVAARPRTRLAVLVRSRRLQCHILDLKTNTNSQSTTSFQTQTTNYYRETN